MNPAEREYGDALRPNMYVSDADVRQSTWYKSAFSGSVFAESLMDDSQFLWVNAPRSTFAGLLLDGSRLVGCSLRDVAFEDCDLTGVTINGVRVEELLAAREGAH
ncbi:pentapeptide repeat-containing protein [Streptomyces sp. NPDC003691]